MVLFLGRITLFATDPQRTLLTETLRYHILWKIRKVGDLWIP